MKDKTTITPELKRFMDLHKISSIDSLLLITDEKLLEMDGVGWRLMKEDLVLRDIK